MLKWRRFALIAAGGMNMVRKQSLSNGRVSVTFELPASIWADSIYLVGEFNNWDTSSLPMKQRRSDGVWEITLPLDAGREYQYRYLVNGTDWQNDSQAERYTPNPFSSENSVLTT